MDGEDISTTTQPDVQLIDPIVNNGANHIQPGNAVKYQRADVVVGIAGIVNVQDIGSALSVEVKARTDAVDVAISGGRHGSDIEYVPAPTGVNGRIRADGPDVDRIRTAISPNCRF